MTVKLLAEHNLEFLRLKGGYTGVFESTLVKIPHSWKSCDAAQMHTIFDLLSSHDLMSAHKLSFWGFLRVVNAISILISSKFNNAISLLI